MINYQYLSYQNLNVENPISHYLDYFFLLDKLDVSIEGSMVFLSQIIQLILKGLLESASKAYYQNDILLLQKYAGEERHKFELTQDKSFLYNSIMLESLLVSVSNKS